MAVKSTETRHGVVAVALHWCSALLILALIISGFRADGMTDGAAKAAALSIHVPLGLAVLGLTLFRLIWWRLADRKPAALPMPRWQDRAARTIHVLFYVVILGMAASGIGMLVLSGAAPIIFGTSPAELPDFHDFGPRAPHGIGAMALMALLILHAGAALHHHFIKRDGLLNRMWFGKTSIRKDKIMKNLVTVIMAVVLGLGLTPARADDPAEGVVLINTFTVPVEAVDDAIAMWEKARDFLKTQPGYISTRLHGSLSPEAKYLLINVAQWESPEAFKAATGLMWKEADLPRIEGVVPGPALYKVIRE